MATMMESDIDQFIQNQKAKLQQERQQLADDERGERVGRRQWDEPGRDTQYAEENIDILRSPELRLPLSSNSSDTQPKKQSRDSKSPRKATPDRKNNRSSHDTKLKLSRQTPTPEAGLNKLGKYEETRKKLKEERTEEYKALQSQLIPRKTIMVRNYTMDNPSSFKEYDYKEARKILMDERKKDYDEYLQTYHHDLLPLLSTPAYHSTLQAKRHVIRRSPSLHHQMLPQFSFQQFQDLRDERVQDSSRKAEVDYKEWERSFQKEKQKDYNDYLEQMKHRSRKQATPPGSGLKFGEFEEYRKKIDRQRKQDYKEELKKQQEEQMLLKAQRDYVNVPFIQTSPRIDPYKEKLDHEISDKIMNQKFKEFDKMMALNKKHDQQNLEKERLEAEKQYRAQKWKEFDENLPPNPPEQQTQSQFERPSDPSHYHNTYSYQKHQQQLKEEREKETRQFFEQRGEPQSNRKYVSPKEETGLQLGKYEDKRKKLEEERKREYNEMLAKKTGKRSKAAQLREERAQAQAQPHVDERPYALTRPQVEESPFSQVPVTAYAAGSDTTRQLQEEKEREYYDLVSKLQQGREDNLLDKRPVDQGRPFSFTANEKAALTMLEEKEREYQQLLKERQEKDRESHRDQLPPKPPTPGGMFNKLGAHDRQREKLNEERKQEYNKLINEQADSFYGITNSFRDSMSENGDFEGDRRGRGRGNEAPREIYQPEAKQLPQRPSTDEGTGASLKGLNPRDSAEIRKKQLRNEEYNEFLRQKGGNPRGRQTDGKPPLPLSAKNPRHRYNDADPRFRRINSATSQRENQKKEDIYASLPGLHYSDSADKRKKAERNREYNEMLQKTDGRRRARSDGPASYEEVLDQKRQQEVQYRRDDPSLSGLRPYNSEGALNTLGDDRYNELDREYESRKVRFRDQRSNILENDQWLDVDEARRDAEFRDLQQAPAAPRGAPKEEPPPAPEMATSYFATLPVGGNERDSAKRRRQDKYREELQLQMQEAVAAKRREKLEDLRVNATGLLDPEKSSKRLVSLGNPEITPRRNIRSPEVQPYHTKFDLSPRSGRRGQDVNIDLGGGGGYEPRERGRRRERGGGILTGGGGGGGGGLLDNGFDGLLESRPRIGGYLPPGIQYQPSFADPSETGRFGIPSTYITGGGGVGNPALSSIDEAYHFYGMRNPLEPEGTGGTGGLEIPLNRLDDAGFRDRMSPPRVTFDDNTRTRSRSRDRISPYQFPSDDDYRSKSRQGQKEYQIELERQIQEKRYRDQKAKEEKERYEKKLEEEIRNYNPFGRGGGGAPIKDAHGNAITDLRSMHYDNTGGSSARSPPPRESPRFRAPSSPKDDLLKPPPVQQNAKGEATFARGGHGIFGHPRTDAEKDAADKYKDDLKRQIEDKKRQEQIEREKERIEEEKENRRLEEQRLRIQKEYDEELRRKKEKEEEARKKNEELRQQAEDRKKEEERKRRADADAKSKERQEEQERERLEKQREARGGSPPIPAVRSKLATENGEPSESFTNTEKQASVTYTEKQSASKPPRSKDPQPSKKPQYKPDDFNLSLTKRDSVTNIHGYDHFRTSSVNLEPPSPKIAKTPGSRSPFVGTPTSDGRGKSPPVPSYRRADEPQIAPAPTPLARANSSDVLKELATMRKQLQSERKRVENALENQKNEPDVFDPRMVQRPPPREIDVFERAKQGHAAVPQRTTDTANPRTLQEFNELKYKTDTDSRRAFRSMFPDAPTSNSALESQQDALLRHQEDTLKNMKERNYGTGRQGTLSPKSMLNSNSAFIDVDGVNHFPEDFEDLPKRNESARLRRRERIPVSPRPESLPLNPLGSTTSLDVDKIQRKNDARLRRLHQMNTDDVSIADPDDILDRFMAKQRHNRPPSGQTLQDDSWLRPGSKAF